MARLESQAKLGYFPCPKEVIKKVGRRIKNCHPEAVLVDPCAGEGIAVATLATALGIQSENVVACELDDPRSIALQGNLPDSNVSGRTDFQSSVFSRHCASVALLNPPYDKELGYRQRAELSFLARTTTMLKPSGVLAFVMPRRVLVASKGLKLHLQNHYDQIESFDFPKAVRKYDECVVLARRRDKYLAASFPQWGMLTKPQGRSTYDVPKGDRFSFRKCEYLDSELEELMSFEQQLENMAPDRDISTHVSRPPLELKDGHKALLLAAGFLNGRITKPSESPHVVRGTSRKTEVVKAQSKDSKGKQNLVFEEKIELVIRTVDATGVIRDIVDSPSEDRPSSVKRKNDRDSRPRKRLSTASQYRRSRLR